MSENEPSGVVPIDPEVRAVLREFSQSTVALATEIVWLRIELESALGQRPYTEIIVETPPPGDGPPPPRYR